MFTSRASSLMRLSGHARLFSSDTNITTVGVVGMGLMGHGIAQLASEKFKVVAVDTNEQSLDNGMKAIEKSLTKIYTKKVGEGAMAEKVKEQIANITPTSKLEDVKDCDIVIEAIVENLDIKKDFYKTLSGIVKSDAILASNTSSFPIEELANVSGDKAKRVVGLHFFNPGIFKAIESLKSKVT